MIPRHYRLLLVDDNPAIHDDFRKVLLGAGKREHTLEAAEAVLFGTVQRAPPATTFEIDSAHQGQEALEKVKAAIDEGRPYALAFVDVRMPPGWDGVETIEHLWRADPLLQVVICTAYSDYSWERIAERLGGSDGFVILKKPFDNIEVLQLAHAMTKKWLLAQEARLRQETLEVMVQERTHTLRMTNAELCRSEERFAKAFRSSPAPLALQVYDDERFVDVNEAFACMTGFTRAELIGKTPLELALLIDYEGPALATLREHGRVAEVAATISTREGDMRQALVSLEKITIAGEPHLLLLAQDITERTRLEAQLRQAQKMEAVGQLAAGIAHDFNNLLTIIQGHSSLQLSIPGHCADLQQSLGQIEQAAERAAELTRQLLAFSRRQIIQLRPLQLNALLERISTMLRRLIGETVRLDTQLAAGLPLVRADATSLEQVIINLAVNARDAMPRGGDLTLGTDVVNLAAAEADANPEARAGRYVRLQVADTGTGMDEQTKARIFEPFFTTKDLHKGTGMGLATVYGIAKQHAGWVEVKTAPGRGTTFTVFLPITTDRLEPVIVATQREGPLAREHTILIVEDDHAVRGLVKEVLVHHRYRVLEADDAASAMAVWEQHADAIELLLTDVVMPGEMNGLQLAHSLRVRRPDLKVIYTSGYSSSLFAGEVKLEDGVNYLPKPYMSQKLTAILRDALEPE